MLTFQQKRKTLGFFSAICKPNKRDKIFVSIFFGIWQHKMNTVSILKIISENKTVLISRNATQEILMNGNEIAININSQIIPDTFARKFKTTIETEDAPDFGLLSNNQTYTIFSIVSFYEQNRDAPSVPFVEDSLEQGVRNSEKFITFRPIFEMNLVNFSTKSSQSKKNRWILEFMEI